MYNLTDNLREHFACLQQNLETGNSGQAIVPRRDDCDLLHDLLQSMANPTSVLSSELNSKSNIQKDNSGFQEQVASSNEFNLELIIGYGKKTMDYVTQLFDGQFSPQQHAGEFDIPSSMGGQRRNRDRYSQSRECTQPPSGLDPSEPVTHPKC